MLEYDNKIGSWVRKERASGTAHVLIVGISEYPHLFEGTAEYLAPDNGGLGQLPASALTAAHVFDVVRKMGSIVGCDVATCRLCLSPVPEENPEVNQLTEGHYQSARFADIESSIKQWATDIFRSGRHESENVAVFFFSGHGVEHLGSPALLASDILDPNHPNRTSLAVAYGDLLQSVKTLGIDRGLFLIDACRDAPEIAKRLHIVGRDIIDPDPDQTRTPEAMLSLMSTSQLHQSYQVKGATRTIYGRALLEALEGPPPSFSPYDTSTDPLRLPFGRLEGHVRQRVKELLLQYTTSKQPVSPAGDPYDGEMLVAVKPRPGEGGELTGGPPPEIPLGDLIKKRAQVLSRGFKVTPASAIKAARTSQEGGIDLDDFGVMHEVFGHESITDPWIENLRMVDMGSGEGIRPNSISVHRAQTIGNDARLTAQFELTIEPSPGEVIWIAAGGKKGASIGVTIPRDFLLAMPVLLDVQMSIDEASGEWSTDSLSAWLGTESPAAQRDPVWRRLCEIQQIEEFADLGSAGRRASQRKVLEKTLQTKRQSPIAAAIAASILIRSNQLEALHDWPRNLANWFKWLPDGPVLWAETLIRRGNRTLSIPPLIEDAVIARARTPEYTEAREYFCRLADGGAPTLTASMLFALGQLPFWHRLLDSHTLKFIERRRLEDACERVERSAAALVSGSMFARYSYEEQAYDPGEVLGHRKRARESLRAATAG